MDRPKVLAVATRHPSPTEVGFDVRVDWLLRSLAGVPDLDVTFLTTARPGQSDDAATAMDAEPGITTELVHVRAMPPRGPVRRWVAAVRSGRPVWVRDVWSAEVDRRVTELRAQHDVVIYLDDAAGQYELGRAPGPRAFFDKHMVLTWMTEREPTRGRPAWLYALRARLVVLLTRRFERTTLALGSAITCSPDDDVRLLETLGVRSVAMIATGVPQRPAVERDTIGRRDRVGFLGALDIEPNLQGLLRFVQDGATAELAALGLTLSVAGRAPRSGVPSVVADDDHVEIKGFVDDLDAWLGSLVALVVPVWTGSGIKTKTLTAMMAGAPVIATPDGFEGIPVESGTDGIVVTTSHEMVAAADRLARDPERATRMGLAGRELVRTRLSLSSSSSAFGRLIRAPT